MTLHEVASPFVVFHYLMVCAEMNKTLWYKLNGLLLCFMFFIFHNFVNIFVVWTIYRNWKEFLQLPLTIRISTICAITLLSILGLYWSGSFLIKTFKKLTKRKQ